MAKKNSTCFLLFDDKILINFGINELQIGYRMDDYCSFLRFDSKTKEFEKITGFGVNRKNSNPKWWKMYRWKEMNERC